MIKQFYEKLLPSQGVYCVTSIDNYKNVRNRFAESLNDLINIVTGLTSHDTNIFVAPGSFVGHSRKAESSAFLRSFFIDLDVGSDKPYDSKQDAQDAIEYLCVTAELPPPVIVDSGGGIHAYWIFDEDVPYAMWKPYATKFKAKVQEYIPIDPAVTADGARIMRAPFTFNCKHSPPLETNLISTEIHVYSFNAFAEYLGVEDSSVAVVLATASKGLDEDTLKMLKHDNIETVFQIIAERSLKDEGCNQIKHILMNAAALEEPLWHSGLSIARHCVDWEWAIHAMSEDYPKYDSEQTVRKANETNGKPHSCSIFESRNPGGCKDCPFRGRITNPLALGRHLKEAPQDEEDEVRAAPGVPDAAEKPPAFPDYLKPYQRGASGGIYFVPSSDSETDPILLFEHDVYPIKRMFSRADGECLLLRVNLPKDPMREFLFPMHSISAQDRFNEAMGKYGVTFNSRAAAEHMRYYINKWYKYMLNISAAETMRTQMGWTEEYDGFVVGHAEIKRDFSVIKSAASPLINSMAKACVRAGSYDLWKTAAQRLNEVGAELHAFTMLISFASPLARLTTTGGGMLCLTGPSGYGKSGALFAGLSVYGNPRELALMGKSNATENAMTAWFLGLKNIPLGIDEASNKEGKEISELIHRSTNGKGRLRMKSNVDAVREIEQSASSYIIGTSNQSMYDKMFAFKGSPDGEAARLIELSITSCLPMQKDPEYGREVFDVFRLNYGHAVYDYIPHLFKVGDPYITQIINGWIRRFQDKFGNDPSYRYYENMIATGMTAGELISQCGIVKFDLERIFHEVVLEVIKIRDDTVKVNGFDYKSLLGEFMNRFQTGVLVLSDTRVTREPRGALVARIEVTNGMFYVSKTEFRKFLAELQISAREFEHALTKDGILSYKGKQRLSNGWSGVVATPISVYGFKVDIPPEMVHE